MNREQQQQHLPSFFREKFNLNKCLFVTTNSNNFQSFLVTPEFAVAKHQTNKFCNKNKQCKYHIMLYVFDNIQNKLMHLNYDFENVNCPYSYFKFFIILSGGLFHCAKQQRSLKEGTFSSDKVAHSTKPISLALFPFSRNCRYPGLDLSMS